MTREELKKHCEKQIEMCELWAIGKGEKPSGKVYEEHKLTLELLEQESRVGHWITKWNAAHQKEYYYCSECREEFSYDGETGIKMDNYDFCPNCGARMKEGGWCGLYRS